jgi:hypothetical protein
MSDGLVFECFSCRGVFAGFGISVGSVDPSLGEPGDLAAGAFCDRCCGTWPRRVAALAAATETPREGLAGEIVQPEETNGFKAVVAVRSNATDSRYACAECGALFMPKRTDAVFCTSKCRGRHFRRKANGPRENENERNLP